MRTRGRFRSFLSACLLAAALGFFLPVCARSQTPPASAPSDSGDGNEKPVSFLSVAMTFDPSGKASVHANYFLEDQPNLPPAEIKQALESSLGCSLQNSSRARPMPARTPPIARFQLPPMVFSTRDASLPLHSRIFRASTISPRPPSNCIFPIPTSSKPFRPPPPRPQRFRPPLRASSVPWSSTHGRPTSRSPAKSLTVTVTRPLHSSAPPPFFS